jgi:hypothetical protein
MGSAKAARTREGQTMMTDRTSTDPRFTWAPALMIVLSGTLLLADRALDGPAQTVARIVLLTAVLAATAWCGSGLRGSRRADTGGRDLR